MDLQVKSYKSSLTNYGYLIKKNEFTDDFLKIIKNELTVEPMISNKYGKQENEPFPIYQEGKAKILLPKYYGIEKLGLPDIVDTSVASANNVNNLEFIGELRDYQIEIIEKCKKHFFDNDGNLKPYGGGVISVPPGKGKTVMAIMLSILICKILKLPFLIIVHKTFLVNQWIERINQYVPNARIGIIQQDKIDIENKDIVIGMLQSICLKDYDEDVFEKFPLVVIDEVHHLGAKVFSKVLLKIQAPYTLGLSATPERKDKLEKVFYWHLGPLMYYQAADIDNSVVIKLYNYNISKPDTKFKPSFNFKTKQMNMAKMVTNLTELSIRNKFIIKLLNECFPEMPIPFNSNDINTLDYKMTKKSFHTKNHFNHLTFLSEDPTFKFRKVLVLSNRVNHLKEIARLMEEKDKRWTNLIGYYIGGMKEKKLKESESKPLILATFEMASEGLDIPDLDTLLLVTPKSSITQSIGRILRIQAKHRKYVPIVYDIVDNISVFTSQGKKRYTDYVTKEYKIEWNNVIDTEYKQINDPFFKLPSANHIDQFIDEQDEFIDENI